MIFLKKSLVSAAGVLQWVAGIKRRLDIMLLGAFVHDEINLILFLFPAYDFHHSHINRAAPE